MLMSICVYVFVYMYVYLVYCYMGGLFAKSDNLYVHALCVCVLMYVHCTVASLTLAGPERISI